MNGVEKGKQKMMTMMTRSQGKDLYFHCLKREQATEVAQEVESHLESILLSREFEEPSGIGMCFFLWGRWFLGVLLPKANCIRQPIY